MSPLLLRRLLQPIQMGSLGKSSSLFVQTPGSRLPGVNSKRPAFSALDFTRTRHHGLDTPPIPVETDFLEHPLQISILENRFNLQRKTLSMAHFGQMTPYCHFKTILIVWFPFYSRRVYIYTIPRKAPIRTTFKSCSDSSTTRHMHEFILIPKLACHRK